MKRLFDVLDGENVTGVKLTESYMMDPVSSVCGLYFASEDSRYFNSNLIDKDQILNLQEFLSTMSFDGYYKLFFIVFQCVWL